MMRKLLSLGGAVGVVVWMSGCSFSKPFPEKSFYRLYPVGLSEADQPATGGKVVSIQTFSASEEFDGKGFVYRLEGQKFEVDFYNEWLTQPKAAVTEWLRRAVVDDNQFAAVVDPTSRLRPDLRIEGRILEWFADFSDRSQPEVAVAIEIRWLKAGVEDVRSSGTKLYRERIRPVSSDPASLVAAWQEAMVSIVASFLQDLKKIES